MADNSLNYGHPGKRPSRREQWADPITPREIDASAPYVTHHQQTWGWTEKRKRRGKRIFMSMRIALVIFWLAAMYTVSK